MVELLETPAVLGLPVTHGTLTLSLDTARVLTSLQPFAGQHGQVSELMKAHHGAALPCVGRMSGRAGNRVYWAGQGAYLLSGPADAALATCAAVVDQTDGWVCFTLSGARVEQALARLSPLDMRASVFKRGHVARTEVMHMMALIARTGEDSFEIFVMRSFARTASHDLIGAMKTCELRDLS